MKRRAPEPACARAWDVGPEEWQHQQQRAEADQATEQQRCEAGNNFVHLLLELHAMSKLPASYLCILCYWAFLAGIAACQPFAKKPGAPSGHYSRHLSEALGTKDRDESLYDLPAPTYVPHDMCAGERDMLVLAPHESLVAESIRDPRLQPGQVVVEDWPPVFRDHPMVAAASPSEQRSICPLALYVDGVPYTNADSFIGFFVVNLVTGLRHMVALLRKSLLCKCGCRGVLNYNYLRSSKYLSLYSQ